MVRNKGDIPRYHMSRTIAYTYGIVLVALFSIIEIFIFESDEVLQRSIETLHFHIFFCSSGTTRDLQLSDWQLFKSLVVSAL